MITVPPEHLRPALNYIGALPTYNESVYFETLEYQPDDARPTHGPRAGARCLSVMAVGEGGDFEGAVTIGLASDDGASLAFNVSTAFFVKVLEAAKNATGAVTLEEVKINGYDYLRIVVPAPDGRVTLDGDWEAIDDL